MQKEFALEMTRVEKLLIDLKTAGATKVLSQVQALVEADEVIALQKNLESPDLDSDLLLQTERVLFDLKIQVDALNTLAVWPVLVAEVTRLFMQLDSLARVHGTSEEKQRTTDIHGQIKNLLAGKQSERLQHKITEISDFHSAILYRQPSFWAGHFEALAEARSQMNNAAKADELIERGRALLAVHQLEELKTVVYHLQDLLPRQVVDSVRRGYDSSLLV
jgi:hypothetical protein